MIKYSKVIASNTDLETSQAFIYHHDSTYLALLLTLAGDDVFSKARQLASDLETEFFASDDSISFKVEESLRWLNEQLKDTETIQILVASWEDEQSSSTNKSDSVLYLKSLGGQEAYLSRDNQIFPLITQDNQLISGYLKDKDRILLLNKSLSSYLDGEGKIASLIKTPVDDLEEEVNLLAMEHQRGEPVSAILISLQSSEEALENLSPQELEEEKEEKTLPLGIPHIEDSLLSRRKLPFKLPDLLTLKEFVLKNAPKTRKTQMYLALALIFILFLGISLTVKKKGDVQKDTQFNTLLSQSKSEFQSAQSLKDLDTTQAEQSLSQAKTDLASALKIKPNDASALDLQKQINSGSDDILKVYQVSSWPLFLDLGLIKSGFSADRLSLSLGKILLLDKNQRSLVSIDLSTKNNQILAGGDQIGTPQEASLNGSNAFVYSSDKGVVMVDTQALRPSVVVKPDSDWGEITDLEGFGGNIYLLDNIKNQIWKYIGTSSGFSDKNSYLKSGVKVDFSGAKKILIDSSVWVLGQNNELDRFTAGSPDSYSVGGLDKPITNLSDFFISDKTNNMYLLDSGNSRLVVTTKSGAYIDQYTGDKFKTASDFVVDEQGKKIYLLDNNKIYTVDLH